MADETKVVVVREELADVMIYLVRLADLLSTAAGLRPAEAPDVLGRRRPRAAMRVVPEFVSIEEVVRALYACTADPWLVAVHLNHLDHPRVC